MSEQHFQLPMPISGPTTSISMGLNDDGELDEVIFILGGCSSPYVPVPSSSSSNNLPFSEEYQCPEISSTNFGFDPKNHTNVNIDADAESSANNNAETEVIIFSGREMPVPRHKHASLSIDGKIWIIGGRNGDDDVISQVDIYDSVQNKWLTLDSGLESIQVPNTDDPNNNNNNDDMIDYVGISDHCMFNFGPTLFLTGGYDSNYVAVPHTILIDTIASLQSNNLVYKLVSPLNVARGGCAAVSHGGSKGALAYVSGGFTHEDGYCEAMSSVERYDVRSGQWVLLDTGKEDAREGVKYDNNVNNKLRNTGLAIGRAHHSLFYYMGHIVAFGGEKRGTFDKSTGRCMDRYGAMEDLTLEMNRERPNRLTFPVDTDEVEILDLVDDGNGPAEENDLVPWVTKKVCVCVHVCMFVCVFIYKFSMSINKIV